MLQLRCRPQRRPPVLPRQSSLLVSPAWWDGGLEVWPIDLGLDKHCNWSTFCSGLFGLAYVSMRICSLILHEHGACLPRIDREKMEGGEGGGGGVPL